MPAGSAVYYLGRTLHGGGANLSKGKRRGMFLGFVVGWLRTEENTFLSVPIKHVYDMPVRAQELPEDGVVHERAPMAPGLGERRGCRVLVQLHGLQQLLHLARVCLLNHSVWRSSNSLALTIPAATAAVS